MSVKEFISEKIYSMSHSIESDYKAPYSNIPNQTCNGHLDLMKISIRNVVKRILWVLLQSSLYLILIY